MEHRWESDRGGDRETGKEEGGRERWWGGGGWGVEARESRRMSDNARARYLENTGGRAR